MDIDKFLIEELENAPDDNLKKVVRMDKEIVIPNEIKESLSMGEDNAGADLPGLDDKTPETITETPGTGNPETSLQTLPSDNGETKFSISETIDSETVVDLISLVFPLLTILLLSFFKDLNFNKKAVKKEMTLDAAEQRTIQKPLDKIMQQAEIGFKSPFVALLFILAVIFGTKFAGLYMDLKEQTEDAEHEEIETDTPAPVKRSHHKKGETRGRPKGSTKAKKEAELERVRQSQQPGQTDNNVIPFPDNV